MDIKRGEVAMENVQHCRAMGSLFRQFAAFDPVHSWKYLIEAQKWEHLAEAENRFTLQRVQHHPRLPNSADSVSPGEPKATKMPPLMLARTDEVIE